MTRQAGIYLRMSSDRDDTRLGVDRQRKECLAKAKRCGWTVAEIFEDNDVSASTGKRRKHYERMLDAIRAGRINAVVCWDNDRLIRRPIEIEHFIELADKYQVELASVGGDIDLSTDNGRLFFRIKGAVARAEIERKSARQKAANTQRREMGRPHSGSRGYGYTVDGMELVPVEAAVIRAAAAELLAGRSLRGIAADLNALGTPTADGNAWKASTLRKTLLRPRLAALVAYRGEETGEIGAWPPILDLDTYRALSALLSDPARRFVGRPRTYLLSGTATCSYGDRLYGGFEKGRGYASYRCRRHVFRRIDEIDTYVTDVVLTRLALPDAVKLFTEPDRADEAAELREEERSIRDRLNGLAEAFAAGEIDRAQMTVGTRRLNARLAKVTRDLGTMVRQPAVAALVGARDVWAAWAEHDTERQRAILRNLLASVVVHSAGRGARRFDPATVQISWK